MVTQKMQKKVKMEMVRKKMNMIKKMEMVKKKKMKNKMGVPSFLEMPQNRHVLLTFEKVHNPLRPPRETTSERPRVVRT